MSNNASGWNEVLRHLEKRHPCLSRLRVLSNTSPTSSGAIPSVRVEELPAFLKVAISTVVEGLEPQRGKPLRLVVVAPRRGESALWTAAGAVVSALRTDFERVQAQLPPLVMGQTMLLDKSDVVQYAGEVKEGLRLRVAGSNEFLIVPHSYRLRLQPALTNRPLSRLNWAGKPEPDPLDELLDIQTQGARHLFSTRVALVTGVGRALQTARYALVAANGWQVATPLPLGVLNIIHAALAYFSTSSPTAVSNPRSNAAVCELFRRAETIALKVDLLPKERAELLLLIDEANQTIRRLYDPQMETFSSSLIRAAKIAQPPIAKGAEPVELLNLFQWGSLNSEGTLEIRSNGQMDAEPTLLLCPDVLPLRSHLRERVEQHRSRKDDTTLRLPLVMFDGASSFHHHLDVLDNIMNTGAPMFVCLERGEEEAVSSLTERGFEVWKWTPDDLHELIRPRSNDSGEVISKAVPVMFGPLESAWSNYARHHLHEHVCADEDIDRAADLLMDLLDELDPAQIETKAVEGALYGVLLFVARLLYQPEGELQLSLSERLRNAREEIVNCGIWLSPDVTKQAHRVLADVKAAAQNKENGKFTGLCEVVRQSSASTLAAVVAGPDEVEPSRRQWARECDRTPELREKNVSFCCPATTEAHLQKTQVQHLVICGWLGAKRMRRLIDGCLATDISLLLYGFERGWLRGALRRWRGHSVNLGAARRMQLMNLTSAQLSTELRENHDEHLQELRHDIENTVSRGEENGAQFDASDFEVRLRVHRRAMLASAGRPHEETEPARLVEFGGGYFAFLSDTCRLPLVNDLLNAAPEGLQDGKTPARPKELPQKRADELVVGDNVVFRRGAAGNLLREMADIWLQRNGLAKSRPLSRLWKTALQEWIEEERDRAWANGENGSLSAAIKGLQKEGITCQAQTIRGWLEGERIGPGDYAVIPIIARITGHEELNRRLSEVVSAVSKVRGAHLSASELLARALLKQLPDHLRSVGTDDLTEGAIEVDIEGAGGAVVVRVEEIGDETVPIALSQINVLQREIETSSSHSTLEALDAPDSTKPIPRVCEEGNTAARTAALDEEIAALLRREEEVAQ